MTYSFISDNGIIMKFLHFVYIGHEFITEILSKFGEQQPVVVNYACSFHQSETGRYFE